MSCEKPYESPIELSGTEDPHFIESLTSDRGLTRLAYSLKEAAEMMGVSQGHLRNEHRRGKLILIHTGRCARVLAADLNEYLMTLRRAK